MLRFEVLPPSGITIKWFPPPPPPPPLPPPPTAAMFFFLMGLVQTLQGAAMSQWPSLKRAPQQITAQGGGREREREREREEWGHRGRSYQSAAECEGQKSRCIHARRTVTRHSSAQGPSERAAL